MKKIISIVLSLVFILSVSMTAFASVTFDPTTGTGFVGKGDVQSALGFNNAKMQSEAEKLVFTLVVEEKYNVTEEWTTGGVKNQKTHQVTKKRNVVLNGVMDYVGRKANQYTGFFLTGYNASLSTSEGVIPAIGDVVVDPQAGNQNLDHVVVAVEKVESTSNLFVNGVALPIEQ